MVREATPEDLADINRIENYWIAESFAHFGTEPVPRAETTAAFQSATGRFPWVVKTDSGKVVGFARAGVWKVREGYHWTTEIGVYVDPNYQGKGVGGELYGLLFPKLQELGFHTIVAGIALPNDASVRLHEKFGMTHAGTFPEMGFKHGSWRSVGYWYRILEMS